MIERYSITKPLDDLIDRFSIESSKIYKPRYNASPTQILPVITQTGREGLSFFYWGQTPSMAKNKPVGSKWLFVSAEKIFEKSNLKRKLDNYRCIIPMDGFFAWKKVGKKEFIPYRIIPLDQSLFSVPGLWEEFEDENGRTVHTFSIVHTRAPQAVESITPEMPVILYPEGEEIWMDNQSSEEDIVSVLKPYSNDELSLYTVSSRIAKLDADSPDLIKPAPASDQHGNYSLFD